MADETTAAGASPDSPDSAANKAADSLLEQIILEGRMARSDAESRTHARDLLAEFVEQTSKGLKIDEKTKDTVRAIEKQIADIDRMLSDQLNAILHAPEFQALEAPGAASTTW